MTRGTGPDKPARAGVETAGPAGPWGPLTHGTLGRAGPASGEVWTQKPPEDSLGSSCLGGSRAEWPQTGSGGWGAIQHTRGSPRWVPGLHVLGLRAPGLRVPGPHGAREPFSFQSRRPPGSGHQPRGAEPSQTMSRPPLAARMGCHPVCQASGGTRDARPPGDPWRWARARCLTPGSLGRHPPPRGDPGREVGLPEALPPTPSHPPRTSRSLAPRAAGSATVSEHHPRALRS